jgi:periplasmic protein TonB
VTGSVFARRVPAAAFGISVALHAALFAAILAVHPPPEQRARPVDVEIVETRPRPPEPSPAPRAPPPRPIARRAIPPPRRVEVPLPRDAPPPPPVAEPEAPPPPNAPPPEQAPRSGPVRIGLSMSSTTTAGDVAAPVGNTMYGKAPERADDPAAVQPYRAERYVPPTQVTTLPEPLGCDIPKDAYPEEAKRLGFEADVRVRLAVDEEGRVTSAKVVQDPGHGLGAAAAATAKRYCRFRPARRHGEAVATEIPFTLHFELQ